MPVAPRVLVVEDAANIRELVCLHLELEGCDCVPLGDGLAAIRAVGAERFDLIVLDLMLPGVDGISVCRAIRREGPNTNTPVLMLTARHDESDKVLGLESGADDYLTKPFGVRELVARARALLRRASRPAAPTSSATTSDVGGDSTPAPEAPPSGRALSVHGLDIDPARRSVKIGGREIELTAHEFDLLYVLASHPGIVFSRHALLGQVWRGDTFVTERSVDTLVKRLRRKIEPQSAEPALIRTVWGAGYKMADV